jgi:site-specific DNA-cytosine methylase
LHASVRYFSRAQPEALLVNAKHPTNVLDEPSFAIMAKGDGRGVQGSCAIEWPWDTMAAARTENLAPGAEGVEPVAQPARAIRLSEKAAALLQGFPEDWQFVGKTKRSRWAQIGMAVPPPLAEAVARSVWAALAPRAARAVWHLPRTSRHAERA